MRTFNVGVIGIGTWGRKVLEEWAKIPVVRVVAVSDPDEGARAFSTSRYGVPEAVPDYEALVRNPDIAAVHVAAPNALHFPICKAALEAGKHVLVEKPMCETAKDAHELVRLAESRNLTLSVGHIFRFNNALTEVRRLVRETFFGRVFQIEMRWSNLEPVRGDRDIVFDLAPHVVDILNFLLDGWPTAVTCSGSAHRVAVEETAVLWMEFERGVRASANLSWLAPPKTRTVTVVGENRAARVDVLTQAIEVLESGYTYQLAVERNNTIRDELMHFIKSVGDPLTETRNSGLVGARVVDVLQALQSSMKGGARTAIPPMGA